MTQNYFFFNKIIIKKMFSMPINQFCKKSNLVGNFNSTYKRNFNTFNQNLLSKNTKFQPKNSQIQKNSQNVLTSSNNIFQSLEKMNKLKEIELQTKQYEKETIKTVYIQTAIMTFPVLLFCLLN